MQNFITSGTTLIFRARAELKLCAFSPDDPDLAKKFLEPNLSLTFLFKDTITSELEPILRFFENLAGLNSSLGLHVFTASQKMAQAFEPKARLVSPLELVSLLLQLRFN